MTRTRLPETPLAPYPTVNIVGVAVHAMTMQQAIEAILTWVAERARSYVVVSTVHSVMEARQHADIGAIVAQAGLVTPDGMPLVFLCRWAGHPATVRVYGPDLLLALCQATAGKPIRHYFYGGAEGVAALLAETMKARYPGLQVAGSYSPPFRDLREDEVQAIAAEINASGADVVWVGLGCPKQERWMGQFRPLLNASVLIGVGAAFDFHTGRVAQAPRWMQRMALEWLFRLLQEPKRLWRRYVLLNPLFVLAVVGQWLNKLVGRHR